MELIMSDLFISYARSDAEAAERLVKALSAVNVVGWLDHADIAAGNSFGAEVRKALLTSDAVLVLLSPRALHSEWVQFEIGAAESLGKYVIPVIISGEHLEQQLPEILRNRQWIDARERPEAEIAREVRNALSHFRPSETSPVREEERAIIKSRYNEDHFRLLKEQGVKGWNEWRKANPEIMPTLQNANLKQADLREADFTGANLHGTNLSLADLRGAKFNGADLQEASLWRADIYGAGMSESDLRFADLSWANLSFTNLQAANLSGANLAGTNFRGAILKEAAFGEALVVATNFANVDLSMAKGLEIVRHIGPSEISMSTIYRSRGYIPERFLRGTGIPEPLIVNIKALIAALSPIEFYSCFISYSSKDQEFAERLHADLRAKNVRCWFAPSDLKIGDRLRPSFDEAIRISDKLLLLLSESSAKSFWVTKEVDEALEKERREKRTVLFPIRLDDAVMETNEAWAADIRRTRHIGDFRDWKNHDAYKKALDRLLRDLKAL
jgi:uncharacterized protein YjbI with pentapeptide repeats